MNEGEQIRSRVPFDVELDRTLQRAKQRGYRYRELMSAGHDAMITQPRELTKILIELA